MLARDIWSEIMFSANRGGIPTLAAIAFSGFALLASLPARCEATRPEYGRRQPVRQNVWHATEPRPLRSAIVRRAQIVHASVVHAASDHEHGALSGVPRAAPRGAGIAPPAVAPATAQSPLHAPVSGNAPRSPSAPPLQPPPSPLLTHPLASRGPVPPQRQFEAHVWHPFGRALEYQTFAPAVQYPTVYYSWALAAWSHPLAYSWHWRMQPWYPSYGALFTPYGSYASPDLWMTDYILAQSMQAAYQAQPPTLPQPAAEPASLMDSGAAPPDTPGDNPAPPQPGNVPLPIQPGAAPSPATAPPPAITPAVKAQLDTQIKVQLRDRQAAAAMPATLITESAPPALRPDHVFFGVVQPLSVPSASGQGFCSLKPNDYIRRTGGMSPDDWMIPVIVELSAPSDCPAGLHTRIGLNDLNAMESEQEVQVMEALQAASKSMGPNGPPNTPGAHPALIADSVASPDLSVLGTIGSAE